MAESRTAARPSFSFFGKILFSVTVLACECVCVCVVCVCFVSRILTHSHTVLAPCPLALDLATSHKQGSIELLGSSREKNQAKSEERDF